MLQNYNQFLLEKRLISARRELTISVFSSLEGAKPVLNEAIEMVELGIFDDYTIENIANWTEEELNESIISKAKERFQKAKETLKQKGKDALSKTQELIIKFGGNVANAIKMVINKLQEAIKKAFEAGKKVATAAISKSKEKVRKALGNIKDPKKLSTEIKNAKGMLKSFAGWVLGGFSKEATKGMETAAKQDESLDYLKFELILVESIILSIKNKEIDFNNLIEEGKEGPKIPFISSIAAKLNKIPPFKTLYGVKNKAKDIAGAGLEKFSVYATEVAGAPGPYKFIALATIIGILVEMEVKGIGKKLLKMSLHGIPGAGTVIVWAANIAKYLAYIAIIETLLAEVHGKEEEPEAEKEPKESPQ